MQWYGWQNTPVGERVNDEHSRKSCDGPLCGALLTWERALAGQRGVGTVQTQLALLNSSSILQPDTQDHKKAFKENVAPDFVVSFLVYLCMNWSELDQALLLFFLNQICLLLLWFYIVNFSLWSFSYQNSRRSLKSPSGFTNFKGLWSDHTVNFSENRWISPIILTNCKFIYETNLHHASGSPRKI